MPETCVRFREHGARVLIEDKEIDHYAIHVDPAKKEVSCWIASEANKKFSVVWLGLDVEYPSASDLYLDGHLTGHMVRRSAKPKIFRRGIVSESLRAPFIFSPLIVTDDDKYLDTSSHSIGEIKLVISRTTAPKILTKKQPECTYFVPPQLQKVHERSKKAIPHRVGYGSVETSISGSEKYTAKPVETLVTFIFKYRPIEMLRANDIIPRNPASETPKPRTHGLETPPTSETSSRKGEYTKVKRDDESGSEIDDEDSLSRIEKALLAEVERIRNLKARKRHLKDDGESPKKKLKKEDKDKPFRLGVFTTPDEIIDLT